MTDVFEQTAGGLERERQLLERHEALFAPLAAPVADIPPVPASDADLLIANQNFDPATVLPGTRYGRLKTALQRLLSVYTSGQVSFNAAVIRILNGWNARLSTLLSEVTDRLHEIQEKNNRRFELVEQRRNVVEGKFSGELKLLRDRISELEADLAALQLLMQKQAAAHPQEGQLQNQSTSSRSPGTPVAPRR
jgi:hypothetical protein